MRYSGPGYVFFNMKIALEKSEEFAKALFYYLSHPVGIDAQFYVIQKLTCIRTYDSLLSRQSATKGEAVRIVFDAKNWEGKEKTTVDELESECLSFLV